MASLVAIKGPSPGQRFALEGDSTLVGRQPDVGVYLDSLAVSRQHARIVCDNGAWFVEDVGSSNGTYLNGTRITGRMPLTQGDSLQIGPYVLGLRDDTPPPAGDSDPIIRARVDALSSNHTLFNQNPAYKLQVVLEIAQHLGNTLDPEQLLGRLLEHLLRLFPQADRGMVGLNQRDHFIIRAQRTRQQGDQGDYPYSRTLVRRALEDGVGLLCEDVGGDGNPVLSATLLSLKLRSYLCVPLIGWEGRRLGVIQLDCLRAGQAFDNDDLELLTAIGLQVAVVLQNAAFHAQQLREQRLRQELQLAREIQQSFLPNDFDALGQTGADLFARVHPAREVSGDLYDFFRLPDGRLAFYLGDVSGKGMPAALFMIAVRTLMRHLTPAASGPADLLQRLDTALVADNPTALFVTLVCGIYDDRSGSVVLASGGHPPPLLRRADGQVEEVALKPGTLVGSAAVHRRANDVRLVLALGETLILYTDGFTEAFALDGKTMFGLERLRDVLASGVALSLEASAEAASAAVGRFAGRDELQDDQTLLLLRRRA